MLWIEKVDAAEGRLCPVFVNSEGQRTPSHMSKLPRTLVRFDACSTIVVESFNLQSLSRASSLDYTRSLGLEDAEPDGHEVFCFTRDGKEVLIPAAVLLYAFVPRMRAFGDRLLIPGSLDLTFMPVVSDRAMKVSLPRGSKMQASKVTPGLQNKLLWLSCFQSGRKFWGSVYEKASQGVMGLELPAVKVDGSLYGLQLNGKFLAIRFALRSIEPMEVPLEFAEPLLPGRLDVNEKYLVSVANLRAAHAKAEAEARLAVPEGPNGLHFTDTEWDLALSRCREKGYRLRRESRALVDLSLEKHASGRPWSALGRGSGTAVLQAYHRWRTTGAWDIFLSIVMARVEVQRHSPKP